MYTKRSIKIAVEWWCDRLKKDDAKKENGIFFHTYAAYLFKRPPLSMKSISRFRRELRRRIIQQIESGKEVQLYVDYDPIGLLREAVDAADIDGSRLPWKTRMTVTKKCVSLYYGYQSPLEVLFPQSTTRKWRALIGLIFGH